MGEISRPAEAIGPNLEWDASDIVLCETLWSKGGIAAAGLDYLVHEALYDGLRENYPHITLDMMVALLPRARTIATERRKLERSLKPQQSLVAVLQGAIKRRNQVERPS